VRGADRHEAGRFPQLCGARNYAEFIPDLLALRLLSTG
jgi:hypothetical protein